MAKKIRLTRPELNRQRDMLERFERYLPMLKLKQQQLQVRLRDVNRQMARAQDEVDAAAQRFEPYRQVLNDVAGVNVHDLAQPEHVEVEEVNVAGVVIPVYQSVRFPAPRYSLFGTPAWVDRTLLDLREISTAQAKRDVLAEEYRLLSAELTKIVQRVNLFEKVKIPEAQEAIRVIRIHLGDQMTAAVGRAKIAKKKLSDTAQPETGVKVELEGQAAISGGNLE